MTVPDLLTFADVAGVIGDITGTDRRQRHRHRRAMEGCRGAGGMPAPAADFSLSMFRAAQAGVFAVIDPLLETAIGHRPRSVRPVLETIFGTS